MSDHQPVSALPEETVKRWTIYTCPACGTLSGTPLWGYSCPRNPPKYEHKSIEVEVVPAALLDEALEAIEEHGAVPYGFAGTLHMRTRDDKLYGTASHIRQSLHEEKGT